MDIITLATGIIADRSVTFTATVIVAGIGIVLCTLLVLIGVFYAFGAVVSKSQANAKKKEAKKMQADLEKNQQELAEKEFEASAGGNAVSVKVNGQKQILDLKLQKEVVDPEDVEMLQDLIVTCINQAFKQVDDAQAASMGKFNIPGIM